MTDYAKAHLSFNKFLTPIQCAQHIVPVLLKLTQTLKKKM